MQAVAQHLEGFASLAVGVQGEARLAAELRELTTKQIGLIPECWSLKNVDLRHGCFCFRLCNTNFTHLQRNAGQQQVCERRFAWENGPIEKGGRGGAKFAGLEMASFVEKQQSLIQVQEPGPNGIFFLLEHLTRPGKTFQG